MSLFIPFFLDGSSGSGVAQRLCNGPPRNNPGLDSELKNRAPCPLQGTVNGGTVSK